MNNVAHKVQFDARVYLIALLAFPMLLLFNYLYNHQAQLLMWLPQARTTYFFTVLLPFGIILPALALGWMIRRHGGNAKAFGASLKFRDALFTLLAFGLGLGAMFLIAGQKLAQDPNATGTIAHLFIWLLMASIMEVMVFIGLVFHATEAGIQHLWQGRSGKIAGTVSGILVSAVTFGVFHFSYPPPWDTLEKATFLSFVWVAVVILYAFTRSLVAAIIFDNMLAIVGFVLNNAKIDGPEILGLALDAIAIVAAIAIIAVLCAAGKTVRAKLNPAVELQRR